jgi:hypothetical protein
MKLFYLLLLCLLTMPFSISAKVEIMPYGKKISWDNSWNELIGNEIDQKENNNMVTEVINQDDLDSLECPGFNTADVNSKKDFWVVFLSSLTRAESAFNPNARSHSPKGGNGNYGLLQLSKSTARVQCGINDPKDISDPALHLGLAITRCTSFRNYISTSRFKRQAFWETYFIMGTT